MSTWTEVLNETRLARQHDDFNGTRRKAVFLLSEYTKRNAICYYSGWLQNPEVNGSGIADDDMHAFMVCIQGMDVEKGLDLILHTPGGEIAATESIIYYLHRKFDLKNIRVIVPQLAMSAGTIIACSSSKIIMGKQSSLGPIDPQLQGLAAYGVIHEFERAHKEIKKDPSMLSVWQFILDKYHPTFLSECENAIKWSKELAQTNLAEVMFTGEKNAHNQAEKIVKYLTAYHDRKDHGRHINIEQCHDIGLKVMNLEDDQKLQESVLTIHHHYMYTLASMNVIKIVENNLGRGIFSGKSIERK